MVFFKLASGEKTENISLSQLDLLKLGYWNNWEMVKKNTEVITYFALQVRSFRSFDSQVHCQNVYTNHINAPDFLCQECSACIYLCIRLLQKFQCAYFISSITILTLLEDTIIVEVDVVFVVVIVANVVVA